MRLTLLLLAFLPICSTLANPVGQSSEFDLTGSGLRLEAGSGVDTAGKVASFAGVVELSGTLAVAFDRAPGQKSEPGTTGAIVFYPDAASRSRLPRAVGQIYPGTVDRVDLDCDPEKFLPQLVGDRIAKNILDGDMPTYRINAKVTLTHFRTSVECGMRQFEAELVNASASHPNPRLVASAKSALSSC